MIKIPEHDITHTRSERLRLASRERREHQRQELREAILTAAAELFVEQGYDRFSLRQVAERIGYSPTTIYLYFENKDDLLFQVADEGYRRFSEQLIAVLDRVKDPLKRLQEMCRVYVRFGLDNPAYYNMMFCQRPDSLEHARAHGEKPGSGLLERVAQAVQEAIDAGALPRGDAASYGDAMWAAVHGIVTLGSCMPMFDQQRRRNAIDATLAMIFDGLRKR